jgi:diguanylate cyclase
MAHGERTVSQVSQKSHEMDLVRKELDEYKRIANTDSLTRIANRRAFDEKLSAVYANDGHTLSALVLADIDNFKKVNDAYGHPVGDKILATVANYRLRGCRHGEEAAQCREYEDVVSHQASWLPVARRWSG